MRILKIILAVAVLPLILVAILATIDDNKSLYKKANTLIYRYSNYPSQLRDNPTVLEKIQKIDSLTKYYNVAYGRYLFYSAYENGVYNEDYLYEAIDYIEKAIAIDPEFFDSYFYGFYIYYQLDNQDKANEFYKKAEELTFTIQEERRLNYMSADIALKEGDYDRALVYAQKIYENMKDKKNVASALDIMIKVYKEKQDYEKVESLYKEYIKLNPTAWTLYSYGTFLYVDKKDYIKAFNIYEKALEKKEIPIIKEALEMARVMKDR